MSYGITDLGYWVMAFLGVLPDSTKPLPDPLGKQKAFVFCQPCSVRFHLPFWFLMLSRILDLGQHWTNFGLGNGLLPDATKPLPDPIIANNLPWQTLLMFLGFPIVPECVCWCLPKHEPAKIGSLRNLPGTWPEKQNPETGKVYIINLKGSDHFVYAPSQWERT